MRGGLNAQYVVQPYYRPGHIHRYRIKARQKTVQQSFTWRPSDVRFTTRPGAQPSKAPLASFHYHGPSAPADRGIYLHINLFMHDATHKDRVGKGARSVVLDSFTYTPFH
jgi:hypothetical protein